MLNIARMQHVQSWDAVHAKCNILFDGYLRVVTQFPWRLPFNVLNVFCSYDCWWMTLPFCWSWRTESTTHCQGIVQRSASEAECGGGMDVSSFSILSVAIYCKRVDLQWLYDSLWAAAPMGMKLISDRTVDATATQRHGLILNFAEPSVAIWLWDNASWYRDAV